MLHSEKQKSGFTLLLIFLSERMTILIVNRTRIQDPVFISIYVSSNHLTSFEFMFSIYSKPRGDVHKYQQLSEDHFIRTLKR